MIWNKSKECMSRDEMSDLQGKRLHKLVELVYHNVPFYREKMQALDLTPEDIRSIEDIRKLPFTTKQDLRDNYPTGLQAASQSEIVRVHASSGTTGNPTIVGYTRRDLEIWRECSARAFTSYGVTRDDVFSVGYGYGLFTGGLGAHYGVEYVGATLRVGAFGAEPWTENMREEIEARLGLQAYNLYGLSEIIGPGVSYECPCKNGSHISEDHFYPEIIDPETLEPQPYGTTGELVFTTLTKTGMPLLRYRTKDLCSLIGGTCDCGRTNVRMTRIIGRSDDMLIIRGINVFPSQVESVILEMPEFEPTYMLVVDRINNLDTLQVQVEVRRDYFSDELGAMLQLRKRLADKLKSVLSISADVRLMEPNSIPRSEGKSVRVIDKRQLK